MKCDYFYFDIGLFGLILKNILMWYLLYCIFDSVIIVFLFFVEWIKMIFKLLILKMLIGKKSECEKYSLIIMVEFSFSEEDEVVLC